MKQIGQGNFGVVSKALLSELPGQPGYLVAVKVLQDFDSNARSDLLREAAIMAQFQHHCVVGLVGVVTVDVPVMVVLEYCENGSLHKYLNESQLSLHEQLQLATDCVQGLSYLSSRKFVHRDIAARNVLLDSEHRAKIGDFGMSRDLVGSTYYRATSRGQVFNL